MGRFEDWLRRPGAPLRDHALAAWMDGNPQRRREIIDPYQERFISEYIDYLDTVPDRNREFDVHRHYLEQSRDAAAEELHATMLMEELETDMTNMHLSVARGEIPQDADFDAALRGLTERFNTQATRLRRAHRRYDNARNRCMTTLEPHPRRDNLGGASEPFYNSVGAYERRFTYDYTQHGQPNPVVRTLEEMTDERDQCRRELERRRTRRLEQTRDRASQILINPPEGVAITYPEVAVPRNLYSCCMKTRYPMLQSTTGTWRLSTNEQLRRYDQLKANVPNQVRVAAFNNALKRSIKEDYIQPTCRPGMKRKFDDESRQGGGGGAGSLCA